MAAFRLPLLRFTSGNACPGFQYGKQRSYLVFLDKNFIFNAC